MQTCVLLSGGMDSTAALHLEDKGGLRAIGFRYGQPNADHELVAAGLLCERLAISYAITSLADGLGTRLGLLGTIRDHDPLNHGEHSAFLPGRNAVFLSVAAAHAASWWPTGKIVLVVGACLQDASGFPDCRSEFFAAMSNVLGIGMGREVEIRAPFLAMTKTEILRHASPAARVSISRSWSCYRSDGPCGTCTPCVLRREAFTSAGVIDRTARAKMFGGDPHRT